MFFFIYSLHCYISNSFCSELVTLPSDLIAAFRAYVAAVKKGGKKWIFRSIYLPICAQALSCVCFTHCKPLSAWNEWQAYNLDCILMLFPYAAKRSGDSWRTVRRSGGKGDIEFYAPLSASQHPHTDTRWRQLSELNFEWGRYFKSQGQLCVSIFNDNLCE